MQTIGRDELQEKVNNNNIALVEVLDAEYYRKFHLPGALNIPLDKDFDQQVQEQIPDKNKHVVVYCQNTDCDASPKAAERLEELGYVNVYDYAAGKEDWRDAELPIET